MRAIASSTPSKRPIDTLNCWRTRPYAPVASAQSLAMPTPLEGSEIERPAARQFISIFQPCPAYSTPPMTHSIGTNTSLPQFGPFMKTALSGRWRRPMCTPGCLGRDQRERDADVFLRPEQVVRIVQTESEPEQRRDRPQRDIALLPREPDAQHIGAAFPLAAAHDAEIGNVARVRARFGARQRETRHLQPFARRGR